VKAKPVVPRARARQDVDEAIEFYLSEGAFDAANGFVNALQDTYSLIGRNASIGSPRYSHELNIPGLRSQQLSQFPYLVFYLGFPTHIEIWRVLHGRRDIPAWLSQASPD
jgi:toxin ParE1/3/4